MIMYIVGLKFCSCECLYNVGKNVYFGFFILLIGGVLFWLFWDVEILSIMIFVGFLLWEMMRFLNFNLKLDI